MAASLDDFHGVIVRSCFSQFVFSLLVSILLVGVGCERSPSEKKDLSEGETVDSSGAVSSSPDKTSPKSKSIGLLDDLEEDEVAHSTSTEEKHRILFADVHQQAKVEFTFDNGASEKKLMPEATSGGGGWIDYDRDGWPDLYFPQGGQPDAESWVGQPLDQLFRNSGDGTFQNVTQQSFLVDLEYGHGVAIADYNNDGFDDIYVSNVGDDVLYHNLGDGTFERVPQSDIARNSRWASSAAWGDLDLDGDLDLYVCNYVNYDPHHPIACFEENQKAYTCHPREIDPIDNVCFFNNGDGTFREEANERGMNGPGSKSLGVVIADFNGDGWPDLYVANDTTANHFFVNQGGGKFEEQGLVKGCSMSGLGQFQASMGLAFGDYDRNGFPDLYVSHFTSDSNTLYRNLGPAGFTDATRETGLHHPTLPLLAFGTVMQDFNLDGWQDLFIANGHIDDWRERTGDQWYMKPQLFSFDGRRWNSCGDEAGDYFQHKYLGRAVATADYDRDGDLDLLVVHQNDPAALLQNNSERGNWLQFSFVGTLSNRNGIGVKVHLKQNGLELTQQLPGGSSYCASHQPTLVFGVGDSSEKCEITITWPGGRHQEISGVPVNQVLTVLESDAKE